MFKDEGREISKLPESDTEENSHADISFCKHYRLGTCAIPTFLIQLVDAFTTTHNVHSIKGFPPHTSLMFTMGLALAVMYKSNVWCGIQTLRFTQ